MTGAYWLMLLADDQPGALPIYTPKRDVSRRFRVYALAAAALALLPEGTHAISVRNCLDGYVAAQGFGNDRASGYGQL